MKQDLLVKGFLFTSYFSDIQYSSGYLLFIGITNTQKCSSQDPFAYNES